MMFYQYTHNITHDASDEVALGVCLYSVTFIQDILVVRSIQHDGTASDRISKLFLILTIK